jgi:hypothetical protein
VKAKKYTDEIHETTRDELVGTYDDRGRPLPRTFRVIGETILRNSVASVVLGFDSQFTNATTYVVKLSPVDDGNPHAYATEYRVKYISGKRFDIKAFGQNVPAEIAVRFIAEGY